LRKTSDTQKRYLQFFGVPDKLIIYAVGGDEDGFGRLRSAQPTRHPEGGNPRLALAPITASFGTPKNFS